MAGFSSATSVSARALVAAAEAATGLTAQREATYAEGLALVADGLRQDRVDPGGRAMLANEAVNYLVNRLRIDDLHASDPSLAESEVSAPIVILGLPRTGTTLLSYLFDQDPQWRSLLNWEAVQSVPPPTADTLRTDPRCTEMRAFQEAVYPTLDPPPPHWEWADSPTECTFLLAQDFRAMMWDTRIPNPAYSEFISTCDMEPAYRHHKRCLQVLQSQAPGRWVLKMPAHAYFIDALLAVYPDAQIIWAHRDPYKATASFLDLVGFAHRLTLGEPDTEWIRATYPDRLVDYIRRSEAALADRNVHHVHYRDLVDDPIAAMGSVYDWQDIDLTRDAEDAIRQWVADDPIRKPRKKPYGLAEWGLSANDLDPLLREYVRSYDIDLETV